MIQQRCLTQAVLLQLLLCFVAIARATPLVELLSKEDPPILRRNLSNNDNNNDKNDETITTRIVGGTTVTDPTKYPYFLEWEDAK